MESYTRIIEAFRKIIVSIMVTIFFLSAVIGWFMAKSALAGVEEVTGIAKEISEGSLEKRVPLRNTGDEIDQLAATFNHMLDRIQRLITGTKEMSDNIAHDLRSPVTRIRGTAEVTLTTDSTIDEYKHLTEGTVEECDRLLSMINTMLIISKTEAGINVDNFQPLDIAKIVNDAVELFQSAIIDKGLKLTYQKNDEILIKGETRMIQRVIANLLDNAIKYSTKGGEIGIDMHASEQKEFILSFKDTGIGISEKDLPHIFERFYRCDPSRSISGSGLGLSLAKAIVESHGGVITSKSVLNEGSRFTVTLPTI